MMSGKSNEHQDILNELATDERRLLVARNLPPSGNLPHDDIVNVVSDFKAIQQENGVTLRQLHRDLGKGFSQSVLSQVLSIDTRDKVDRAYMGDIDEKIRKINQWNEDFVRSKNVARPTNGFVQTKVAKKIFQLIKTAKELRKMGLIYGPAGVGKTMTLQATHDTLPGIHLIRADESCKSISAFRNLLKAEFGLKSRNALETQQAIYSVLKGTGRTIIIDEAQKLTVGALDLIRDIHDVCKVTIILSGTVDVMKTVNDTDVFYGQFSSRIAMRYNICDDMMDNGKGKKLFTIAEIKECFSSDKIRFTKDGLLALLSLANIAGYGCLRLCEDIVLVAAKRAKGELIDEILIRNVRLMLMDRDTNRRINQMSVTPVEAKTA